MRIAEKKRPQGKDHMEIYYQKQQNKAKKIEEAKKLQEQKEIEQCTFSPKLIASSNPIPPPKIELNVGYEHFLSDN